jgi:hypothetical protein
MGELDRRLNHRHHVLGAGLNLGTRLRLDLKDAGEPGRSPAVYLVTEHV